MTNVFTPRHIEVKVEENGLTSKGVEEQLRNKKWTWRKIGSKGPTVGTVGMRAEKVVGSI